MKTFILTRFMETDMSKAQTDIRATSYNAATANPSGYTGTIDDAIAQIRAEPDEVRAYWPLNVSRERHELLGFLGILKVAQQYGPWRNRFMAKVEDDSVAYGVPATQLVEPGFYTLAYAQQNFPQSFKQ